MTTFLESRKRFLIRTYGENYPFVKKKFWARKLIELNKNDFWQLKRIVDALKKRKYPDELVEKLLTYDTNDLLDIETVLEGLYKMGDLQENMEVPFSIPYEGVDFDVENGKPEKKRKKNKIKGLGEKQKLVLDTIRKEFEVGEEFKSKELKNILKEEINNLSGILKMLIEKTGEVESLGKRKYRRI